MLFLQPSLKCGLSSTRLLTIASLLITVIFNYPFLSLVYQATHPASIAEWCFLLSVVILLACLTIIFLSLSGAIFFPRLIIGLNILIGSLLFYATHDYGVIFDRSMIQNMVETNTGEALSYLNISFALCFACLGLLPIAALFKQKLLNISFLTKLKHLVLLNVLALVCICIIAALFYKDFAAVGRNNRNLIKYIVPFAFYDAGFKYLRERYFYPPLPYKVLDKTPTIADNTGKTLVVVVGETARAQNFSLNGYPRPTNALLNQTDALSFTHVTSCGTATAVSVPCMFSRLDQANYDNRVARSQDNVLDIIHRAGADVTWIDNNSSCKGVCERINTIGFDPNQDPTVCDGDFCLDEVLLKQLKQQLDNNSQHDRLIVLHMIGSHGPTYFRRYPDQFKKFLPDCPQSDIQHCSQAQLVNTYDNTIAYTDYILNSVIKLLKERHLNDAAMLYVSDHGESLGEKGLYLHGFPYRIAPEEQTHIAMIYWDNRLDNASHKHCVEQQINRPISHDNLFDTLLGLSNVKSTTYQPDMDIFSSCSPRNPSVALTMPPVLTQRL